MTTIAQIEVGQRFKLQRSPQGAEYIKLDGNTAENTAKGLAEKLGASTKVLLPPYATTPDRDRTSVWVDGAPLVLYVSPFLARHFADLRQEYGNPSEVTKTALGAWRLRLRPLMPLAPETSDMQALCAFTGLRPQEVIEMAVYDLWKGYKGL